MSKTQKLERAKAQKNDEFYTLYQDIEKIIPQFKDQLRGKVVFLNCDGKESNFFKYFWNNFNKLGIKRLLQSSSDFAGEKSIKMLEMADVVITNPPFSKIRKLFKLLMEKQKDFVLLAPLTAINYKNIFPFIAKEKVSVFGTRPTAFKTPEGKMIKKTAALWITTLKTEPKPFLILNEEKKEYQKFLHNQDIININRTKNIPNNYFGKMAVPITFIEKWNPSQFEVLSRCNNGYVLQGSKLKQLYARIIIKNKKGGVKNEKNRKEEKKNG